MCTAAVKSEASRAGRARFAPYGRLLIAALRGLGSTGPSQPFRVADSASVAARGPRLPEARA
jgi:hypothetical protein